MELVKLEFFSDALIVGLVELALALVTLGGELLNAGVHPLSGFFLFYLVGVFLLWVVQ